MPPRHPPCVPPAASPSPRSRCAAPYGTRRPDRRSPSGLARCRSRQSGSAWDGGHGLSGAGPIAGVPAPPRGCPPRHLDGRCITRALFSASSRCRRVSSSRVSSPCSAAACPCPSAASSSGLCGRHRQRCGGIRGGSPAPPPPGKAHLVAEHEGDDLQHVQGPLLLRLGAGQELEQVVHAADVQRPQHPVVHAGVTIHTLRGQREGGAQRGGPRGAAGDLGKGPVPVPAPPWGPGGRAARCAAAAGSSRSAACPPPAAAPSPGATEL